MRYLLVNPKRLMRPSMRLNGVELDRLFAQDNDPPTVRRPDLANEWASRMNSVKEIDCRPLTTTQRGLD